jgi:polar amino acid transport system substrate-binding protein
MIMRRTKVILIIAGLTFLFTANALAGPVIDRILQKKELVVGISGNQPPLSATSKEGDIIGLEADLAQLMADTMGVKIKFEVMPFSELVSALQTGKVEMVLSGMTITPERNLKVAFVGPYFMSGKSIVTTREKTRSLESVDDINTSYTTLVALKGSTSQNFVQNMAPEAKLITTRNYDEALNLLLEGKADAIVADYPFCALSAFRYREKQLIALNQPFTYEPLGIALPADDPLLINWVENFLLTLEGSGALKMLTEKWFKDSSWLSTLPSS